MNDTNSNLEFRKVKSLQFLYEVNENGTILRNVKSKKQCNIFLDTRLKKKNKYVTFINIKGELKKIMIHKIIAECWLGDPPKDFKVIHIDKNIYNNHYTNLRYVADKNAKCLQVMRERNQIPVRISFEDNIKDFPSLMAAAKYFAEIYDNNTEHFRSKLKKRRSQIYDYKVEYPSKCRD